MSTNNIINSLKSQDSSGTFIGRGLSFPLDPQKQAKREQENTFINSLRNRTTRSLSMDERNELQSLIVDKPKIDLEINFDYNSANISEGSVSAVRHLGEALTSDQLHGQTFVVSGYTDAVGGEEYNQDLSNRRADTIKKYLMDNYHIAAGDLVTVGYGKTHLKDAANPDSAVNRRVQVVNSETPTNTTAQK
jgi:outer membrane protein OmpA-like peptidoglycan-associated protein